MAKQKRQLKRGELMCNIIALWVSTGLLIGAVVFIPGDIDLGDRMARIAYGLVCLVTVWAGVSAWYWIKDYTDAIYDAYVAKRSKGGAGKEVRL